ncbi:hypothetical protein OIU84_011733 [Salix udensis]|uniref:Uncharacterized protein n=1 Tax=Salix udensis TaxID=889485 RepID=A0AAD6JNJ6_9ROSI|nr:hypothetical protein OIU84_011733 [Salix udensis]
MPGKVPGRNYRRQSSVFDELLNLRIKTEAVAGRSVDNIYGKTEDQEYIKEIKELHAYLDTVKTVVRPGCSPEVLKIALNSMSTLFNTLTFVSSVTRPRASL